MLTPDTVVAICDLIAVRVEHANVGVVGAATGVELVRAGEGDGESEDSVIGVVAIDVGGVGGVAGLGFAAHNRRYSWCQ